VQQGVQSAPLIRTPSEALDVETYRRILDVNLTGAVLCARQAIAHFVKRGGGGSIINCSSVHQIIPKPGYLAYSIAKGAMANLTRTLALEFAGRGIRVNAVAPGYVTTRMTAGLKPAPFATEPEAVRLGPLDPAG